MSEITAASQEQSAGIEQVNMAVTQMDEMTQQNAALVEEASAAAESMRDQAQALLQQVSQFKIAGGQSQGRPQVQRPVPAPTVAPAGRQTAVRLAAAKPPAPATRLAAAPALVKAEPALKAATPAGGGEWEEF